MIALRYAELDANFIHYTKSSTKLFFGLGPYLGLNLPSKTVVITDQARTPTSITFGKNNADMFRGVDYGANGILGVRFKCNVTFAVNYAFGIRNLIPQPEGNDDVLRNGYVAFRLGYLFKNAPKK